VRAGAGDTGVVDRMTKEKVDSCIEACVGRSQCYGEIERLDAFISSCLR